MTRGQGNCGSNVRLAWAEEEKGKLRKSKSGVGIKVVSFAMLQKNRGEKGNGGGREKGDDGVGAD